MNLFDSAKSVGLAHVKSWLPNGRQEGPEWVCLNPNRNDKKDGSFKINLDSGRWADWGDDQAGNDIISCYAYINRSHLENIAAGKNYKNLEAGIQTEAAREILETYDSSYFPGANDNFTPTKSGDFWEGFRQLNRSSKDFPEPLESIQYMSKFFGEYKQHWTFTDQKGLPLFIVARFFKDGKKNDRPFTLWTNGTEKKWRAKNLEGVKLPLFNLPEFTLKQNIPVLMVEGQKCADAAHQILSENLVCSSVYRSIDKTELEPLRGRELYYWFDPDQAGRKKLKQVKEAIQDLDVIFHAVQSPTGKKQGWDIADAIEEGWDRDQLLNHIVQEILPADEEPDDFIDDIEFPFRIIGQTATDIYFFPKETTMIMKFKRSALGKANLMNLMPREAWGTYYAKKDGGIAWDSAADFLIRKAAFAEIFSSASVRGSGAWIENNKTIINTGRDLIRDGQKSPLFQKETKFVYEKNHTLPYSLTGPMATKESKELLKITGLLDFDRPEFSLFLAGWIMLAPFGGALRWRPHAWLSGSQGAGKSYTLDEIVFKLVGKFAVKGLGASTTAGIRQDLGNCSKPVIVDEAEADHPKQKEKIEELLSMARQASSGGEDSAAILHGNQDGTGTHWIVKSMFMFASIGPALVHPADKSRVTLLTLKTPRRADVVARAARFKKLSEAVEILTEEWARSFHARTLLILPEVLKAINIFSEQATILLGTRRAGDQSGTLLAGAYMISSDTAPTAAEAKSYIESLNLSESATEVAMDKDDEQLCMDEIMSYKVEASQGNKLTIGTWVRYWFAKKGSYLVDVAEFSDLGPIDDNRVRRALEEHGVKLNSKLEQVAIANSHPAIKKILSRTPWEDTYSSIIERLDYCEGNSKGSSFFGPINARSKVFKAESLLSDEVPF